MVEKISGFLDKFKKLWFVQGRIIDRTIFLLKEIVGIEVEKESVVLKDKCLYLKVSPTIKSKVFSNKQKIIEQLKKDFGQDSPNNIR
jgi:hypothetical protein